MKRLGFAVSRVRLKHEGSVRVLTVIAGAHGKVPAGAGKGVLLWL